MKVHSTALDFCSDAPVVLTVGTFDGVHVGHRAVLNLMDQRAKERAAETVLLTFHPHPRTVLHPNSHQLHLLNSVDERTALLEDAGLDHLVIHPFTEALSRLSPLEYIREIFAEGIRPDLVIVGYDHRFGRNREGSIESLRNLGTVFGFDVEELPAHSVENTRVSSTKVREAIAEGNMLQARQWLDRPYPLSGKVVRGEQLGRKMGYPTANLVCEDPLKLVPGRGAYAAWARIEGETLWQPAMVNIGTRPTVNGANKTERIEVHLLEGGRQCYDENISLRFMERLRNERQFDGLKALQNQLEEDENKTRSILSSDSLIGP